jgi:hypothetical protein
VNHEGGVKHEAAHDLQAGGLPLLAAQALQADPSAPQGLQASSTWPTNIDPSVADNTGFADLKPFMDATSSANIDPSIVGTSMADSTGFANQNPVLTDHKGFVYPALTNNPSASDPNISVAGSTPYSDTDSATLLGDTPPAPVADTDDSASPPQVDQVSRIE